MTALLIILGALLCAAAAWSLILYLAAVVGAVVDHWRAV